MKRLMTIAICAALLAVLILPAAAFAGKGNGKVPPGQAKKAAAAATVEGETPDEEPADVGAKEKKQRKEKKQKYEFGFLSSEGTTETPEGEESGATERVHEGIENALTQIEANIAKAEAKVAEGKKKQVPPGLIKVMEKFRTWLGLPIGEDPFDGGSEEPTPTPDPSGEPTPTPDPSEEPTPVPDPSLEPTPTL